MIIGLLGFVFYFFLLFYEWPVGFFLFFIFILVVSYYAFPTSKLLLFQIFLKSYSLLVLIKKASEETFSENMLNGLNYYNLTITVQNRLTQPEGNYPNLVGYQVSVLEPLSL